MHKLKANPFSRDLPYIRQGSIDQIVSTIKGSPLQGPQHYALQGPLRIGKTTLLAKIVEDSENWRSDDGRIVHTTYMACKTVTAREEAFRQLSDQVMAVILEHGAERDQVVAQDARERLAAGDAAGAFRNLVHRCEERKIPMIFVLDDFDELADLFVEGDMSFIRELIHQTHIGLLFGTKRPLGEVLSTEFSSPGPTFYYPGYLGPFSLNEAKQYLETRSGALFSQTVIDWIIQQAGTHPCFLQTTAAIAWENLEGGHAYPPDQEAAWTRQIAAELEQDFSEIWKSLDELQQGLLYEVAHSGDELVVDQTRMGSLLKLEHDHGVLWAHGEHKFEIMGEIFRAFIISKAEKVNRTIGRDFYEGGMQTLRKIPKSIRDMVGSPRVHYRAAFEAFDECNDYAAANKRLAVALSSLLNSQVLDVEMRYLERLAPGTPLHKKIGFIRKGFSIPDMMNTHLVRMCEMLFEVQDEAYTSYADTQLRFYVLSGMIQYLVNAPLRIKWENPGYRQLEEVVSTDRNVIWKALHINTNQIVAIKCPNDHDSARALKSLRKQIDIIKSLSEDRRVVRVIDLVDMPPGIVMEWVEGTPLDQRIKSGSPLPSKEVVEIAKELASILRNMHVKHILHGDLKPGNILISTDNIPVLIDFDVAFRIDDPERRPGIGFTHTYASPEQLHGDPSQISPASDVFSMGIVLYQLLTCRLPFEHGNAPELYPAGHLPLPLQKVIAEGEPVGSFSIPDGLYHILCAMLAENPAERPQDGAALIDLFEK